MRWQEIRPASTRLYTVLADTRRRSATSFTLYMVLSMKPYLAQYLHSRDQDQYEKFIRTLSGSSPPACRRFVRSTMEMMRPYLRPLFPSLTDDELRWMADECVAWLDIPDELPPLW